MILNHIITGVYLVSGVILFLLGLLILRESPRQKVNLVTAFLLFFASLGPTLAALGLLLTTSSAAPAALSRFRDIFLVWEFFFPQLVLFSLVFPKNHRVLESHPRVVYFLYLPAIFHFALRLTFQSPEQILSLFDAQKHLTGFGILLEPLRVLIEFFLNSTAFVYEYNEGYFALINLLYVLTALVVMQISFSRLESPRLRQQLRLVIWGVRLSIGFYAVAFLLPKFFLLRISTFQAYSLTSFGLIIGAGSITWAVLRHQFLNVQFIIRRGFVYSVVSGMLVGIYLLLYSKTKELTTTALGPETRIAEILFLIIALVAFQPLMGFFEGMVDRVMYRRLGDYRKSLEELGREVLTTLDKDKLRERVVNALTEILLIERVYLLLPASNGDFGTHIPGQLKGENAVLRGDGELVSSIIRERPTVIRAEFIPRQLPDNEMHTLRLLHPVLLFPLFHRDELQGILTLGRKITRTEYSPGELSMLSLLANEIAVALENIQLYEDKLERQRIEEELSLAKEIQQSLLPGRLPASDQFEVAALNIPSKEVGGDYYDFVEVNGGRLGIAIGDVSGKGIPGALLMSNLQAVFRAYARRYPSPRMVVSQVNDHLACTTAPEKYVTFFYGVLDPRRRRFTYTNAGHNYPLLCREGRVHSIVGGDLILGVRAAISYHQKELKLRRGDILVFYTDGVTEACDNQEEFFGEKKLHAALQHNHQADAAEICHKIYDSVKAHTRASAPLDDLTLVILKMR